MWEVGRGEVGVRTNGLDARLCLLRTSYSTRSPRHGRSLRSSKEVRSMSILSSGDALGGETDKFSAPGRAASVASRARRRAFISR